ncbi:MAG: primosomal protein N' [Parcubacteria group bacterium]|jgi:primosomal protein N' (replication factor Y)
MLPKRVIRRGEKENILKKENPDITKAKGVFKPKKQETIAIIGGKNKRKEYVIKIIKKTLRSKKQCLILVPEIFHAFELSEQIRKIFPGEEISLIHSKVAKGKIYRDWKKIKNNDIKIIISTKVGVFLPFYGLGAVVAVEPQDVSHKQSEAMPRFNAVFAAEFLAKNHQAKMLFSGSILPITNYPDSEGRQPTVINFRKKIAEPKVEVVNLALEKKKADFPISEVLYQNLARSINSKKQSIVLVNRKGLSTFSKCQSCSQILKCPKCKKALVYFEEHEEYRCLHCSHKIDLLSSCPNCGGYQFSHYGIGIQMVEKKLKNFFPSVVVSRLDSDVMKSSKKYKRIKDDFESGKISILVGTQIAVRDITGKNLSLVGVAAVHDFFNLPDFGTREAALSSLFQAKDLLDKDGTLVLQTFLPNDPVISYLGSEDQESFLENEMKFRKKMNYPPFKKIIKLVYRSDSKKNAVREAKKIFDDMMNGGDNNIEISEPYESMSSGKRGLFLINILIKIPPDKNLADFSIFPIVRGLKKGWAVDIDPVSII